MSDKEKNTDITLFEHKELRRLWHKGEWYYSITDVIAILTDSPSPRPYWAMLKKRAKDVEGFDEALVQIEQLPLKAADGKFRNTDTANRQTLLRIIQSIPSSRAEPFRLWLAQESGRQKQLKQVDHPSLLDDPGGEGTGV